MTLNDEYNTKKPTYQTPWVLLWSRGIFDRPCNYEGSWVTKRPLQIPCTGLRRALQVESSKGHGQHLPRMGRPLRMKTAEALSGWPPLVKTVTK